MKLSATLLVGASLISTTTFAQNWMGLGAASEGVTTVGKGRATATITTAEITGLIESQAELAGDAMVKFKGAKRRALDAVKNLEIENLSVKEGGISVAQSGGNEQMMMQRMMGGAGGAAPKPQVQVAEKVTLVVTGIDKMDDVTRVNTLARIIDAGTDAGLLFGSSGSKSIMEMQMGMNKPPNIITYVSPDADAVTLKATELAVAEARKKANEMAKLSGVTLGKVVSVTSGGDLGQSMYNGYNNMWQMMFGMTQKDEEGENRLISAVHQPIPVEVTVSMSFEIK
ncbi:MAG: SIMPL domain-containing protein [Verrucomicrobiota bacterium]